jgi:hypothetical protein
MGTCRVTPCIPSSTPVSYQQQQQQQRCQHQEHSPPHTLCQHIQCNGIIIDLITFMPETTINTSPLSPSADNTSTGLASSPNLSQIPVSPTLDVGSVTTRSDLPETSPGHLSHQQDYVNNHNQVALTFFDRVKEIMSDNQLVINTFIAGGLAGATSRTVVSPLERLKIIL